MKRHSLPEYMEPCPFCASEDLQMTEHIDELKIKCKCGAELVRGIGISRVNSQSINELINQWNTRKGVK